MASCEKCWNDAHGRAEDYCQLIEDYKKVLESTLELMANHYCDHLMFMNLLQKRDRIKDKIEELTRDKQHQ